MTDSNPLMLSPGGLFSGRYQIVRCIASGGMGAVYEAIHLDTQRSRALKVMLPQLVSNEQLRQRFKQEATVVSKVQSQHVVEITDAGVDPATGAPFIVMEFLVGSDLNDILKQKGPMKPHQLGELMRQAALALDRTHAHGIVHRDLKPENLFVTLRDDGTPHLKVVDFGIAKVVADGMRSTNQTATIGTPAYMAPEQIQSKTNIGPATDVYSLAMVAYTMLVGEPYFAEELDLSENAFQIIVAVTKGITEPAKARALRRRGVQLPDAVDAWFARATALDPAQRYPSAGALAAAFREAIGVGGGDMRMSLPDAGYAGAPNLSTGEFLAGQSMQTGGSGRISHGTEVAGPIRFGSGSQPNVTGNARTISAAIADPPPAKKEASSKWPYALVGIVVLAGGGFTLSRLLKGDEPKNKPAESDSDEDTDKVKPAKTGTASPSGTSSSDVAAPAPGASCPAGMLLVGRGTFPMGGTDGESKPVHKVTIGPYCIAKTEVSVAEYKKCVDAQKCQARTDNAGGDLVESEIKMFADHCNYGKGDKDNHPMNCVGFADAEAYCSFVGARLPTEPEWELAARGVEGREFPWGGDIPSAKRLNGCGVECREVFGKGSKAWDILFSEQDGFVGTSPVGQFPEGASPLGALDMAGNVAEWTADWLVLYEASVSTLEDPKSPAKPASDPRRAVRGGSFMTYAADSVVTSSRKGWAEDKRAATVGFRCASDAK